MLPYPTLPYRILSHPLLTWLCLPYPILPYPFLSFPILSYPFLSFPIISYPFLSFPILSFPFLSFFLSFPFLSFLFLSFPFLKDLAGAKWMHALLGYNGFSVTPALASQEELQIPRGAPTKFFVPEHLAPRCATCKRNRGGTFFLSWVIGGDFMGNREGKGRVCDLASSPPNPSLFILLGKVPS